MDSALAETGMEWRLGIDGSLVQLNLVWRQFPKCRLGIIWMVPASLLRGEAPRCVIENNNYG